VGAHVVDLPELGRATSREEPEAVGRRRQQEGKADDYHAGGGSGQRPAARPGDRDDRHVHEQHRHGVGQKADDRAEDRREAIADDTAAPAEIQDADEEDRERHAGYGHKVASHCGMLAVPGPRTLRRACGTL